VHICYLHNPFRYLWERETYGKDSLPYSGLLLRMTDSFRASLQRMDRRRTREITHILTNSQYTAERIKSIYDCEAEVVYPPVNYADFPFSDEREDFYLSAGRLLSYKHTDLAIKACRSLGRKLVIAGSGPEEARLRRLAGGRITFLGSVSDQALKKLYAQARALIFPGCEDFGIIPVEAQAAGCPVIAFGQGGILESVIPEQTGVFFDRQSPEVLMDAILRFEQKQFNHRQIRQNSKRFDTAIFKKKIQSIVERYLPNA
jgi:glycosyltransferase involved in cell wall biosynthesis